MATLTNPPNRDTPAPAEPVDRSQTDAAAEVLELAEEKYGFIPNQIRVLNKYNPATAKTYIVTMNAIEDGILAPEEREAVILAVSRYNDCHYCTRTHAKLGLVAGLSRETIEAIHRGGLPEEPRLRLLVRTTRLLLDKRGWLEEDTLKDLEAEGIGRTELYEINALIGLKIFSNYVNHVAQTEVDDLVTDDPEIQKMWPVLGTMNWE